MKKAKAALTPEQRVAWTVKKSLWLGYSPLNRPGSQESISTILFLFHLLPEEHEFRRMVRSMSVRMGPRLTLPADQDPPSQ